MNSLRYIIAIILLCTVPQKLQADVIYRPYPPSGIVFSSEIIGSYEVSISKLNTIDFWGGFGVIADLEEMKQPAFGSEIALEFRQYFKRSLYQGLNVGLYIGTAYMRYPFFTRSTIEYKNSVGFIPGIKLTYKVRLGEMFGFEPYLSISTPIHSSDPSDIWKFSTANFGMAFTLGFRIGLNIVE